MPHRQPPINFCTPVITPLLRLRRFTILSFLLAISACGQHHPSSLRDVYSISLQPVGTFPASRIAFLQTQLTQFLHKQVFLLPPVGIPRSFRNDTKGLRYSADSLMQFLSQNVSGTKSIVIGLTTEDIYTTVRDNNGAIKEPRDKYAVWGIFGLGYCPGKASIVSTYRLQIKDEQLFLHRLRTVVFHELGHNLGLPHCPNPHCIMNDANEKIVTIDSSGANFCASCLKKLN